MYVPLTTTSLPLFVHEPVTFKQTGPVVPKQLDKQVGKKSTYIHMSQLPGIAFAS
jgi:hypothetical protein